MSRLTLRWVKIKSTRTVQNCHEDETEIIRKMRRDWTLEMSQAFHYDFQLWLVGICSVGSPQWEGDAEIVSGV